MRLRSVIHWPAAWWVVVMAALISLAALYHPPAAKWEVSAGAPGHPSPPLKPGLALGQPLSTPGSQLDHLSLRFHPFDPKIKGPLEILLLAGGAPPQNDEALTRRVLRRWVLSGQEIQDKNPRRLEVAPALKTSDLGPLFVMVRPGRSFSGRLGVWLTDDEEQAWPRAQVLEAGADKAFSARPGQGWMALTLGSEGKVSWLALWTAQGWTAWLGLAGLGFALLLLAHLAPYLSRSWGRPKPAPKGWPRSSRALTVASLGLVLGGLGGLAAACQHAAANRYLDHSMHRSIVVGFKIHLTAWSAALFLTALVSVLILILLSHDKTPWKKLQRRGCWPLIENLTALFAPLGAGWLMYGWLVKPWGWPGWPFGLLCLFLGLGAARLWPGGASGRAKGFLYGAAGGFLALIMALNLWVPLDKRLRPPEGPNVVLIVVDTLRADHLGCYGYERATSPHIDQLARESTHFLQALSAAPWTSPSFSSLLTACYPRLVGFWGTDPPVIDERFILLAEIFRENNYATEGIISHSFLSKSLGFGQGFDAYDEDNALGHQHVSSPSLTAKAVSFIRHHRSRPFFLFLHYFDPHYAYILHPEYNYYPDYQGGLKSGESIISLRKKAPRMTSEDVRFVEALYDSEIRFTDEYIGRLLSALKELGLFENTLIVFTADHGEEFCQRGDHWIGHTKTVFEEQIHVPLLIKPAGPSAGEVVEEAVQLLDVGPTILDLAGLARPKNWRPHGRSLLAKDAAAAKERAIVSETRRYDLARSVIYNGWKLVVAPRTHPQPRLFDLVNDPGETTDLAAQKAALTAKLMKWLFDWDETTRWESLGRRAKGARFSEEQIQRLKSLGYM